MTVLTQEEIDQCISTIAIETNCSLDNMPPIKRSNSAPPIAWTSFEDDYEAPEALSQKSNYFFEEYVAPLALYSTVEYSEFYYKCSEAQRKKLHLPKCPQRITKRTRLPPTPMSISLTTTTPKSFPVAEMSPTAYISPKKNCLFETPKSNNITAFKTPKGNISAFKTPKRNNNIISFKQKPSQETDNTIFAIKSNTSQSHQTSKHPLQKKDFDNWCEARKKVESSSNVIPQYLENEQIYKHGEVFPPYPSDIRYNDQMQMPYNTSNASLNEYKEYPHNDFSYGYSYHGYPSNEVSYENDYSYAYDRYSYQQYPSNEFSYENNYSYATYPQNCPPPNATNQAPQPIAEANPGHGTKQNMIDDFKANDPQSLQSAVDTGYLRDIITCSEGSRLVQRLIEVASDEEKAAAFNVLCPDIVEISKDQFGNYVIQKFFEFGNEEHKPYIIQKLFGNVMHLSLHSFGCRVVQKAIEYCSHSPDIIAMLLREVQECDGISKCMYDPNGNHVIQRFIEKAPSFIIDSIMKAIKGNVTALAQNKFGCRIVQKLLQHSTDDQKRILVKQIIERTIPLSSNPYGNYVIQFLLDNDSKAQKEIFARVYKDLLKLSLNKYGSNVVEKCIVKGDASDREFFFNYVLPKQSHKNSRLVEMSKNEYGNYVIQKMIELANEDQLHRFSDYTRNLDVKLCSFPFGKYIQSRLDKFMKSYTELPN